MKHILSLGAGVQSSTLALMFARGELTPMPDCAIFSDVGAEPQAVYDYLEWLKKELPFPIHIVKHKDGLLNHVETGIKEKKFIQVPFYDETGLGARQCTNMYKIQPINKKIRELCGYVPRQRIKEVVATMYIGISYDEMQRMKDSREKWITHSWPLIEKRMHRLDCKAWLRKHGYPEPPRSSCWFCPFRSQKDWRDLKQNDKESWDKAVDLDKRIRNTGSKGQKVYTHQTLKPLDEVDLDSDIDKGQNVFDFLSECEGMCGL